MKMGEKIDSLLKASGYSKVRLTKMLGLKDSSVITHWVRNRFKPDSGNIKKLAQIFDKPIEFFSDDEEISYSDIGAARIMAENAIQSVGVIGSVSKRNFIISLSSPVEEYLSVFVEAKNGSKPFALKILNADVTTRSQGGEYAIIIPCAEVNEGKTALVKHGRGFMLAEIFYDKDDIILTYGKKQIKTSWKETDIIGVCTGFFRK